MIEPPREKLAMDQKFEKYQQRKGGVNVGGLTDAALTSELADYLRLLMLIIGERCGWQLEGEIETCRIEDVIKPSGSTPLPE